MLDFRGYNNRRTISPEYSGRSLGRTVSGRVMIFGPDVAGPWKKKRANPTTATAGAVPFSMLFFLVFFFFPSVRARLCVVRIMYRTILKHERMFARDNGREKQW